MLAEKFKAATSQSACAFLLKLSASSQHHESFEANSHTIHTVRLQPTSVSAFSHNTASSSATHSSRQSISAAHNSSATRNSSAAAPATVTVTFPPPTGETASSVHTSNIYFPPAFQSQLNPSSRGINQNVRLLLQMAPLPLFHSFLLRYRSRPKLEAASANGYAPPYIPFSSAIGAEASVRLSPLTFLPPTNTIPSSSAIRADPSMGLPPQMVYSPAVFHPATTSTAVPNLPTYTLSTASALPVPSNAVTMDPPPVSTNLHSQILAGADCGH